MKPFSKLFLLLVLVFSGLILQQCRKDEYSCGGNDMVYKILDFKCKNIMKKYLYSYFLLNADSVHMNPNDSIYFELIDSSVRIVSVFETCNSGLTACVAVRTIYKSDWDSLSIITIQEFDSLHKAGNSVHDVFLLSRKYDYEYSTINKYKEFVIPLNQYRYDLSLVLIKKPKFNSAQFKFTFYASKTGDSTITYSPELQFK